MLSTRQVAMAIFNVFGSQSKYSVPGNQLPGTGDIPTCSAGPVYGSKFRLALMLQAADAVLVKRPLKNAFVDSAQ